VVVCDNHRITRNKVFKGIATRGMSSMGWFYGFKLHLVVNERGDLTSFMLTPGNVADNNSKLGAKLCKNLYGKLYGDRGYISQLICWKHFGGKAPNWLLTYERI
jgi:hypothetical protein